MIALEILLFTVSDLSNEYDQQDKKGCSKLILNSELEFWDLFRTLSNIKDLRRQLTAFSC